jgi:hypothetical protein
MSTGGIMPLLGAVGAISVGAAAVYLTSSGGSDKGAINIEPVIDLENQSVVIPVCILKKFFFIINFIKNFLV